MLRKIRTAGAIPLALIQRVFFRTTAQIIPPKISGQLSLLKLSLKVMNRKATGFVDGFILENHTAGGHNAPPRRDESSTTHRLLQFGQKIFPIFRRSGNWENLFGLRGAMLPP